MNKEKQKRLKELEAKLIEVYTEALQLRMQEEPEYFFTREQLAEFEETGCWDVSDYYLPGADILADYVNECYRECNFDTSKATIEEHPYIAICEEFRALWEDPRTEEEKAEPETGFSYYQPYGLQLRYRANGRHLTQ